MTRHVLLFVLVIAGCGGDNRERQPQRDSVVALEQTPPVQPQSPKKRTPPTWRVVERTAAKWRPGSAPYVLIIEDPVYTVGTEDPLTAVGDPDAVPRLRIKVPGRRDYLFTDTRGEGSFLPIKEGLALFRDSTFAADNLVKSPRFYLTPKLRGILGTPMLIVFGYAYASDPGSLRILSLDKSGYPIDVFAEDEFDLAALVDLDGDGVLEIVGKPSLSQCGGCDTCSYDPFAVYRLPKPPIRKATYNLALSRKYNLEHYVWAGTRMSEGIDVNTCNPDKPHLGPARSR